MTAIDGTGLHAVESLAARLRDSGRSLVVCGARKQPAHLIRHSKLAERLGPNNLMPDIRAALERAREIYEGFGGVGRQMARDLAGGRG